jgi:hypothetical protein
MVGYSFWGFLGDRKYDKDYKEVSTPDGNAFYSWCIINELFGRGQEVVKIMPDRDKYGYELLGKDLFNSWCREGRSYAYKVSRSIDYSNEIFSKVYLFSKWDSIKLYKADYILHEWRMEIPGRNTYSNIDGVQFVVDGWQPDLFIQDCLLEYCRDRGVKLVIFDLDYKLSNDTARWISGFSKIIELGDKWNNIYGVESKRVSIPFDFTRVDYFINRYVKSNRRSNNLVYVGNRYERDWCIDKYLTENLKSVMVYGNWLESDRDSKERWPYINFGKRLQTSEMMDAYTDSVCTILFAKMEYCDYGFVTARIIESVFYNCIPLFIEEYGDDVITRYAGAFKDFLTVRSDEDIIDRYTRLKQQPTLHLDILNYLKKRLRFMDVVYFVDELEKL